MISYSPRQGGLNQERHIKRMKYQLWCLLLSLVLGTYLVYGRPLVGSKEPIGQSFKEGPEGSWHIQLKSLERDYVALRHVDGEVEAAIGFAYLEAANEFTVTMSPRLFDAFEELLTILSPSNEKLHEAFTRYSRKRYWDWGQGHFIRLSELEREWNDESGHDLALIFIQSITKAANEPWLLPELFEEKLKIAQDRCSGHMQNQDLERRIAVLGSMLQVTIQVLEVHEKRIIPRCFKFDPLVGSSVMTIHLLVSGRRSHPIFHILTPRERRHYGLLTDNEHSMGEGSERPGNDAFKGGNPKRSASEKKMIDKNDTLQDLLRTSTQEKPKNRKTKIHKPKEVTPTKKASISPKIKRLSRMGFELRRSRSGRGSQI